MNRVEMIEETILSKAKEFDIGTKVLFQLIGNCLFDLERKVLQKNHFPWISG
jgi:hypothetical protein